MGLMDELRKLTQPYGDEDDFFEGADGAFKPQSAAPAGSAQFQFENTFADEKAGAPEPAVKQAKPSAPSGGFFSSRAEAARSATKPSKASRRTAASSEQSVIRFNPKDFDEAGELVNYLDDGRSLIMSLEDNTAEMARRLLDFMSGIAFALDGKITPVSARTYFITPENVDLLDARTARSEESDFE